MKREKSLTRKQKECVVANKMSPKSWELIKETEFYFYLRHKGTWRRTWLSKHKGGVSYA